MQKEIIDFINTERTCVLTVEMMDGSPHAATVHFAFNEDNLIFYFETYREYKKCEALFGREISRASVVIGCNENVMKTLQMDGEVQLLKSNEEKEIFERVYLGKFPNKKEKSGDLKFVTFSFKPKWWRFTDWTGLNGKMILSSDDK